MAEPEDEPPPILLPCSICSRTFKPESLQKHLKVCEKQATKKRKIFDSSKQRIQGTELAEFLPKILKEKKSEKVIVKKPESNWKERHLEFVAAIRAARGVEPPAKSSTAVSKSLNEKCPHCDRNFGPKAFDRHIEWCKEQKARIPKSPASLIQAKERLEARTKYRAPPLAKSKRTLTREKYSRVSQSPSKDPSPLGSQSAVAFSKPQIPEVKVQETTSRIQVSSGTRNRPKLSSSSPSCTLPGGNILMKRRDPSPSPSKRPFRSESRTPRRGTVLTKNEEVNNNANLICSSNTVSKLKPPEDRRRGKEVKPKTIDNRPCVRKSSYTLVKAVKKTPDPAKSFSSNGTLSPKHLVENTCRSSVDGVECQGKMSAFSGSSQITLGGSMQVKGNLSVGEEDNLSCGVGRTIMKETPKLNDICVNQENQGIIVSQCSIYHSNSSPVTSKRALKLRKKRTENTDIEDDNAIITLVSPSMDEDNRTLECMSFDLISSTELPPNEENWGPISSDNEQAKYFVDSPNCGSGDSKREEKFKTHICVEETPLKEGDYWQDVPTTPEDFIDETNSVEVVCDNFCNLIKETHFQCEEENITVPSSQRNIDNYNELQQFEENLENEKNNFSELLNEIDNPSTGSNLIDDHPEHCSGWKKFRREEQNYSMCPLSSLYSTELEIHPRMDLVYTNEVKIERTETEKENKEQYPSSPRVTSHSSLSQYSKNLDDVCKSACFIEEEPLSKEQENKYCKEDQMSINNNPDSLCEKNLIALKEIGKKDITKLEEKNNNKNSSNQNDSFSSSKFEIYPFCEQEKLLLAKQAPDLYKVAFSNSAIEADEIEEREEIMRPSTYSKESCSVIGIDKYFDASKGMWATDNLNSEEIKSKEEAWEVDELKAFKTCSSEFVTIEDCETSFSGVSFDTQKQNYGENDDNSQVNMDSSICELILNISDVDTKSKHSLCGQTNIFSCSLNKFNEDNSSDYFTIEPNVCCDHAKESLGLNNVSSQDCLYQKRIFHAQGGTSDHFSLQCLENGHNVSKNVVSEINYSVQEPNEAENVLKRKRKHLIESNYSYKELCNNKLKGRIVSSWHKEEDNFNFERNTDSPSDRIWDLASQEFIETINKNTLAARCKSVILEDTNYSREKENCVIQKNITQYHKKSHNPARVVYPTPPILSRSKFSFHKSKRKGCVQKLQAYLAFRMRKKERVKYKEFKIFNQEQNIKKKHLYKFPMLSDDTPGESQHSNFSSSFQYLQSSSTTINQHFSKYIGYGHGHFLGTEEECCDHKTIDLVNSENLVLQKKYSNDEDLNVRTKHFRENLSANESGDFEQFAAKENASVILWKSFEKGVMEHIFKRGTLEPHHKIRKQEPFSVKAKHLTSFNTSFCSCVLNTVNPYSSQFFSMDALQKIIYLFLSTKQNNITSQVLTTVETLRLLLNPVKQNIRIISYGQEFPDKEQNICLFTIFKSSDTSHKEKYLLHLSKTEKDYPISTITTCSKNVIDIKLYNPLENEGKECVKSVEKVEDNLRTSSESRDNIANSCKDEVIAQVVAENIIVPLSSQDLFLPSSESGESCSDTEVITERKDSTENKFISTNIFSKPLNEFDVSHCVSGKYSHTKDAVLKCGCFMTSKDMSNGVSKEDKKPFHVGDIKECDVCRTSCNKSEGLHLFPEEFQSDTDHKFDLTSTNTLPQIQTALDTDSSLICKQNNHAISGCFSFPHVYQLPSEFQHIFFQEMLTLKKNKHRFNFPDFLFSANDNDDSDILNVNIWTRSIKIPPTDIILNTPCAQSPLNKTFRNENEETTREIVFQEKLAENMLRLQNINDIMFVGARKSSKYEDPKCVCRSTSSFFKKTTNRTEKMLIFPDTNVKHQTRRIRSDISLNELVLNVRNNNCATGYENTTMPKITESTSLVKPKIKSVKERDISLLKLVEKWKTRDKILCKSQSAEEVNRSSSLEYVRYRRRTPTIHRLPPLPSSQSSSAEEVYDPYVSAERQMMELCSHGDFIQHSHQQNRNSLPTHSESPAFASFASTHRSAFVSPEPRVQSKSHFEKGDADKRTTEDSCILKSESSVICELDSHIKSHSAGGKFSADSAYGSLNRQSPNHSSQICGKTDETEGDRTCFMSSSSSESSLPPLSTVQVKVGKREVSNLTRSPPSPCTVDANPVMQSVPRMSKFCHECGSKYPVTVAKFCCQCGVRRLAM